LPVDLEPAHGLLLFHEIVWGLVRGDRVERTHDLTLRQLVILLTVYLEPPPHTVRGLARKLGVTKPVVSRALDTMGKHKLLARRRDLVDRRNVLVQRTLAGALYVERLAQAISGHASALPSTEQAQV
jgi:DNA-binding MarR family transcriptional regulator